LEIHFPDALSRRLFSTRALLETRYGLAVSKKIMLRMSVLQAATSLAAIPTRTPFNLRRVAKSEYWIDLTPPNVLRLVCESTSTQDLRSIRAITILGVLNVAD
jgi:hypothetical protein